MYDKEKVTQFIKIEKFITFTSIDGPNGTKVTNSVNVAEIIGFKIYLSDTNSQIEVKFITTSENSNFCFVKKCEPTEKMIEETIKEINGMILYFLNFRKSSNLDLDEECAKLGI